MSSCIVSGCKSGYKTKANEGKKWHMFYPPKNDPDLFATWEQLCRPEGQKLSAKHRVCHKHFPDDMLVTQINIPLQDGCVHQSKLEYWRLKPGAFPCIFEGCGPRAVTVQQPRKRAIKTKKPVRSISGKRSWSMAAPAAVVSSTEEPSSSSSSSSSSSAAAMKKDRLAKPLEERRTKVSACTQTELDWFVVRGGPKMPVLEERANGQSGVFVPFVGLTSWEKKYLMSFAGKPSVVKDTPSDVSDDHGDS